MRVAAADDRHESSFLKMADLAQVATLMDEFLREQNKRVMKKNEEYAYELGVLREKVAFMEAELARTQHSLHIRTLVNHQQAAMIRNDRVALAGWKVEASSLKRTLIDIFNEWPMVRGEHETMAQVLIDEDELTESEVEALFPDSDMEE